MSFFKKVGAVLANSATWLPRGILSKAGKTDIANKLTVPWPGATKAETNAFDNSQFGTRLAIGGAAIGLAGAGKVVDGKAQVTEQEAVTNQQLITNAVNSGKIDQTTALQLLQGFGFDAIGQSGQSGSFFGGSNVSNKASRPLFNIFGQDVTILGLIVGLLATVGIYKTIKK